MRNTIIFRVIILGALAITGITALQTYWVLSTWHINEAEFNEKVNLALYNVARSLAEANQAKLPPRNIIRQHTTNYYVVNIDDEIDPRLLEYFLQKEFENLALNVDFEYAVYDCTTDEMVYGRYINYSPQHRLDRMELGNLPKYEKFTYYFGIRFPTRSSYLFGKMQLSIIFSLILFLTLVFFAYSMYVILRQKQLSEMQKDFINNMTHEFKTPLSTIRISADVFLSHASVQADERLMRYAGIIREQNQRLNQQVEKVLQLARVEKGNFEIRKEPVNLMHLLQTIVESTRPQLEKEGGEIMADLQQADRFIEADALHLTNILHNLLDNAIKYCQQTPCIQVRTTVESRLLRISVEDNGIGIPKEYQSRIFDKFYRVPTGNVHNVKGFGLGLYYVKKICDAHGWTIRADNRPEGGAAMVICIKLS